MKTLIIGIDGIALEDLRELGDEHSTHLRWLMQMGCSGKLAGAVQPAAASVLVIGDQLTRAGMPVETADALSIQALDAELNKLLGSLDDNAAVLVILQSDFVLSASGSPLRGVVEGVSLADIAATLLELGGKAVPAWLPGKSFLSDQKARAAEETGYTEDEEEIVRERLQGLGYI